MSLSNHLDACTVGIELKLIDVIPDAGLPERNVVRVIVSSDSIGDGTGKIILLLSTVANSVPTELE